VFWEKKRHFFVGKTRRFPFAAFYRQVARFVCNFFYIVCFGISVQRWLLALVKDGGGSFAASALRTFVVLCTQEFCCISSLPL
jgi:hypothetical protein